MPNNYDDSVGSVLGETAGTIRNNVSLAANINPTAEAQYQHLAAFTNTPVETVRNMPDAAKQQAAMQSVDAEGIATNFPHLANFLSDSDKARLVHDSIPQMAAVEKTLQPKNDGTSVSTWNPSIGERVSSWIGNVFGLPAREQARAQNQYAINQSGMSAGAARDAVGGMSEVPDQFVNKAINTGSLGLLPDLAGNAQTTSGGVAGGAGNLAGFLIGAPMKSAEYVGGRLAPTMLEHAAGESWAKALGRDVAKQSLTLGTAGALSQLGNAVDSPDLSTAAQKEGSAFASNATTGAIFGAAGRLAPDSTLAQAGARFAGITAATDAQSGKTPFQDIGDWDTLTPEQKGQAVFNYGLNAFFSMRGAGRADGGWWHDAAKSDIAQEDHTTLAALSQQAAANPLRERSPDQFHQFVEDASENGPIPAVYIDANTLNNVFHQSGPDALAVMEKMPDVAGQMHEGIETSGTIKIPTADYATYIAGTPLDAAILPHLKTDPAGMTKTEADQFNTNQLEELRTHAQGIVSKHVEQTENAADSKAVYDKILGQLDATKRFRPDVNKLYATLAQAHYITRAEQMGMKPSELLERYPLNAVAERMGGAEFDQSSKLRGEHLWEATGNNDVGPVYRGNGFVLDPVSKIPHETDFDEGGFTAHGMMGHAAHVPDGATPYKFSITNGAAKLGHLIASVKDGNIIAIHDIEAYSKGNGVGTNVLAHIAANAPGDVKVVEVIDQSKGFWDARGTGEYDQYRNEAINWQSIERHLNRSRSARPELAKLQDGDGAQDVARSPGTSGIESRELSAEEIADLEAQGFKFKQSGDRLEGNRGAYNPETGTIALLKNADLSTYLHELGHHFLEINMDMAGRDDAPELVKQDTNALLHWFGVDSIEAWHNLDFEEQRNYHEQFARGFEAYLMEGKAPSVELQGTFSRFKSWLLNVYKSLSSLNVELTPEVRTVMGRMLASEETIKRAEQVRGYDPLFKSADDAGLTPEQWADYQHTATDATDEAITDLQRRSINDMRWLSNAKAGALKTMQNKAAELRRTIRSQVSGEVWSQPVYQAWQFLTNKENLDSADPTDKPVAVKPAPKSKPNPEVDPSKDSLFTAIAKLGGIDKQQLVSEWGIDPKERLDSGVFGKPVARAEGKGRTLDGMLESLAQHGYLTLDEHGKADMHELEDKFFNELKGEPEYSISIDYDAMYNAHPEMDVADIQHRPGGRLDTASVRAIVGEAVAAKLETLRMTRKDALDPDLVAEMFWFSSGDEMLHAIANADHPREAIDGMTDQRMLEEHGELSTPQGIERAAEAALHNEARSRFMATGLKILTKSPVPVRQIVKAAKEAAHAAISGKKIKDLNVRMYSVAEARANRNAIKAAPKDPRAAAVEQRAALLNNQLVRAATDATEDVRKGLEYFKRVTRSAALDKMAVEDREQVIDLLDRFDLRKNPTDKPTRAQQNLRQWVESQIAAGYSPDIPEALMQPAVRQHYTEMTVDGFRGLVDTIKAIEHIGRERQMVTIDNKKMSLNDFVHNDLIPKMQERKDKFTVDDIVDSPEDKSSNPVRIALYHLSSWMRGIKAGLKPQEYKRNQYDGHELLGPFGQVFERVIDANYHKVDMLKNLSDDFQTKAAELGREWQDSLMDVVPNKTLLDPDKTAAGNVPKLMQINRGKMLGIALHVGNESNFDKLTKGWNWNPTQIWNFLHDNMTEKDWNAVQTVWDLYEKHWPEVVEMNKRLGNTVPPKIEARAIQTKFGEIRGGYAAIKYDSLRSRRGEREAANDAISPESGLFGPGYFKSGTTTNGSLNARQDNYTDRVNLDYHYHAKLMHDTIHDLAYREALIDVNKVLEHPEFRRQFKLSYGLEAYKSMREWLGNTANSEVVDRSLSDFQRVLSYSRTGIVINGIAFRASTVLKHGGSAAIKTSGYFTGAQHYLAKRFAAIGTNYKAEIKGAIEKFPEIRARLLQQDRDYRQLSSSLFEPESPMAKAHRFGHAAVAWSDMMTAVPTAWAAYDRAIAEGVPVSQGGTGKPMSEKDAIHYANKIVREAHGTNIESARSNIMNSRNEGIKMFTTLYGFMNNTYGQAANFIDQIKTPGYSKPEALARAFTALIVPALWAGLLTHGSPTDDKNKDHMGHWFAQALGGEAAGMVPFVRDAYNFIEGYRGAGLNGIESWLSTVTKPITDAYKVYEGHEVKTGIRDTADALGTGLHIPGLGQAGASAQYLYNVNQGKENPQDAGDVASGLMKGHG